MDVKWLPGWEGDVRIKSVNIVDEASNLQHVFSFLSLRQKRRKFCCESIVNGHGPTEGPVGGKLMQVELVWEKRCNERLRLTVPNSWMFLEGVGSRCMVVILKMC